MNDAEVSFGIRNNVTEYPVNSGLVEVYDAPQNILANLSLNKKTPLQTLLLGRKAHYRAVVVICSVIGMGRFNAPHNVSPLAILGVIRVHPCPGYKQKL